MFGSKTRKKNRRILEIKNTLRDSNLGGRSGSKRKSALKKELSSLGGKTYRQEAREDKQSRRKYDRENVKKNKRGRVVGYKEGYDPSKGVKGASSTKSSKSKSKATMTGRERAQQMAKDRIAAKKAGTYKKPKTAQELAKERLAKKNKKK